MTRSSNKKNFLLLLLGLIILDQFLKFGTQLTSPEKIVFNQKGFLGIFPLWVSLLGWVGLLTLLIWLPKKTVGIWLIMAGGISNLMDRFLYGAVIDLIKIGFLPVFNLADLMITAGLVLVIYQGAIKRSNDLATS